MLERGKFNKFFRKIKVVCIYLFSFLVSIYWGVLVCGVEGIVLRNKKYGFCIWEVFNIISEMKDMYIFIRVWDGNSKYFFEVRVGFVLFCF